MSFLFESSSCFNQLPVTIELETVAFENMTPDRIKDYNSLLKQKQIKNVFEAE